MGKTKKTDEQWKNQMRANNSLVFSSSFESFHFRVALSMTMNETIEWIVRLHVVFKAHFLRIIWLWDFFDIQFPFWFSQMKQQQIRWKKEIAFSFSLFFWLDPKESANWWWIYTFYLLQQNPRTYAIILPLNGIILEYRTNSFEFGVSKTDSVFGMVIELQFKMRSHNGSGHF